MPVTPAPTSEPELNIGIFGVDPGGATGLAWGIFDPHADLGDALRNRLRSGSTTVEGDERVQIREIAAVWQAFYRACVFDACLPVDHVWFVCENFVYTSGVAYGGDSAAISTALIWGVEGYRMGRADEWNEHRRGKKREIAVPSMILQTASKAKGFATNARLKKWDVWVVGREHERSAWQHVAYFLQKYKNSSLGRR